MDHFIHTCDSSSLRKKLLSDKELSLDKLIDISSTMEVVDHQSKVMEKETDHNMSGEVYAVRGKGEAFKGCYGCGQSGHRMHDPQCPARGIKCYACNGIGHYATYCKYNRGSKGTVHCVEIEESDEPQDAVQTLVVEKGDDDYLF